MPNIILCMCMGWLLRCFVDVVTIGQNSYSVTEARASHSWRERIFHIDGGSESERSIGRAQTFYMMVECVFAFGDASLGRIHEHGATARLCCACGDGEATVTGVKASQSWRERIFHIGGRSESERSIGCAQTFIRWFNTCVSSTVLLRAVYMIMGRQLGCVVDWRIMYLEVRMIYVVSHVFLTYWLQKSILHWWWQFITYISLVVCNKLYYHIIFWMSMSLNMHVFTVLFCFSLLPLTCSEFIYLYYPQSTVQVQYKYR